MLSCYFCVSCWNVSVSGFTCLIVPCILCSFHRPPKESDFPFLALRFNVAEKFLGPLLPISPCHLGCFVLVSFALLLLSRSLIPCQVVVHAMIDQLMQKGQTVLICTNSANNEYSAVGKISDTNQDVF